MFLLDYGLFLITISVVIGVVWGRYTLISDVKKYYRTRPLSKNQFKTLEKNRLHLRTH